jgi:DNA-binding NarL/FixJ family response regulator
MLGMGKTVKQKELDLSPQTISTHRSHILEKMGMQSNEELIQYALQNQIRE